MAFSRYSPDQRRTMIMDVAREKGRVLVEDLARDLSASSETIRRDLNLLASAGIVRKFHGGACLPSLVDENPFSVRMAEQTAGKRAIARAAAQLFNDGDTLFIDTGTTTLFLAEELARLDNLSVVTNSTAVAATLSARRTNTVFLLGGLYRPDASQTIGEATIEQISGFRAAHVVLTIGAIHARDGVMDFSLGEAQVARAMIEQADRLTVIADHSKVGRGAFARVCQIDAIDRFVTDVRPQAETMDALLAAGVEVIVAD
ncbi:MAG: DeoR/GlpR family DNA-binding transcription regulator [Mesorhizobium sp.]